MWHLLTFDFTRISTSFSYESDKTKKYVTRRKFGMKVNWLEGRHYSSQELEKYRLIGDVEMDNILHSINVESRVKDVNENGYRDTSNNGENNDINPRFRFMNVLDETEKIYNGHKDIKSGQCAQTQQNERQKAMYEFYHHYHDRIPDWVDWEQIQRGIDVFIMYSPAAGLSLYYLSLVPGFSIPKIAEVLQQTKYLAPPSSNKQVNKRLQDTGGFLMSCMVDENNHSESKSSKDVFSASSLRPGNKGWKMALRVRILHAKVRKMLLSGNCRYTWDIDEFGIPINQEDMAATLLAFSVNVLSGIEIISGTKLSLDEEKDYLALWRYLGWLLGVSCDDKYESSIHSSNDQLLPSLDPCGVKSSRKEENSLIHARATLESIIFHLMHPNQLSCNISNHLLRIGRTKEELSQSFRISFGYLYRSYVCRRFIGDDLANDLNIPKYSLHSIKHVLAYTLSLFILFLFRIYTLLTIHNSWFRRKAYDRHKFMLNKGYSSWVEENKIRMENIAKMSWKGADVSDSKPCCPFSLVMPAASCQLEKETNDLMKKTE